MSFSKKIISNYQPKRLAVKLNSKGEQSVVKGHPWVFSNSIVKINEDAITGDLAIIFSKNKNKESPCNDFDDTADIVFITVIWPLVVAMLVIMCGGEFIIR